MSEESNFIKVDPKESSIPEIHKLLLGGGAPRPIALVSTISKSGINNLSPFSFFNAFGANPPTIVFSPSRRGRDGTTKDTLDNLYETGECVVQAVTSDIVHQVNVASTEYDSGIDEYIKSGLTPIPSEKVKPMRVKESPFQMECKVQQIIPLGDNKASGNLVICEVVLFHAHKKIFKENVIEPDLINLVGRNSANYYTKASGEAIFSLPKPSGSNNIGYENLPSEILNSKILSAKNISQLAESESIPSEEEIESWYVSNKLGSLDNTELEIAAKKALDDNDVEQAWKFLKLISK
jgi:flavin reductase (DIM6/NTAB) family NADH-FMN oxidoreductase RutF